PYASFSADGRILAAYLANKVIQVWSVGGQQPLRTITAPRDLALWLTLSGDGQRLLLGTSTSSVYSWELPVQPPDPKLLVERGRGHAIRSDWAKAAACYTEALFLDPPLDSRAWFEYACLQLLTGDEEGYRRTCRQLLERYGKDAGVRPLD